MSSENVFKMSSRRFGQDQYIRLGHTSSRHLQGVFKMSLRRLKIVLPRRLQDVFKKFSIRLAKTSLRHLQDVFKTPSKPFQDVLQKRFQEIFKTSLRRFVCLGQGFA